jgi:Na+/melibiose symporter-like transporter
VRAALTLYAIPSASLVPELTSDYDERTSLVALRLFVFSSAIAFTAKAASALGTVLAGVLLDAIAFPRGAEVAVPAEKIAQLGIVSGPGLLLLYLLTLVFLWRYRLTRESHAAALSLLAERRDAGRFLPGEREDTRGLPRVIG